MIRCVLAVVIGAVLAFIWSFGLCMLMPWHNAGMKPIPDDEAVMRSLKELIPESAVYSFPNTPPDYMSSQEAMQGWEQRLRQGPAGILFFQRDGVDGMSPMIFVYGLLFNGLAAAIAVWMLRMSNRLAGSYLARVFLVMLLPVFASLMTHLFTFQLGFTSLEFALGRSADLVCAWLLAGLVIAALVKPPIVTAAVETAR